MRAFVLIVGIFFLVGCVSAPVPEPMEMESGESIPIEFQELTFEGNGDTFLSYIGTAVAAKEDLDGHRLVEIFMADGVAWQGEALLHGDTQTVFLQQAQAGSESAVQLEAPIDAKLGSVVADLDLPIAQPLYAAHPEIQFVKAHLGSDGTWDFDVTLTYPDTGWEDYVDGWLVTTPADEVLGRRVLLHPHVNEQPFTRSLGNVTIPDDVSEIIVHSHNLISGYAPEVVRIPINEAGTDDTYEVIR